MICNEQMFSSLFQHYVKFIFHMAFGNALSKGAKKGIFLRALSGCRLSQR
jgi:hypothetical protein